MSLDRTVPFGRSLDEYTRMFQLGKERERRILGVGDGPASFNAEASRQGWRTVSVDPVYRLPLAEIEREFLAGTEQILEHIGQDPERWARLPFPSPAALRRRRMEVFRSFAADLPAGAREGRYIAGAVPHLPFAAGAFDLALSSHFLFLYSDLLDLEFHLRALVEMLRVAPEVRVFPLRTVDHVPSPFVDAVVRTLEARGCKARIEEAEYYGEAEADRMLVLGR